MLKGTSAKVTCCLDNIAKPTVVQVRIKTSKTDPFRKGVSVYLGQTGNELCPVTTMTAYLAVRVDHQDRFLDSREELHCRGRGWCNELGKALQPSGVDVSKYSGHSFRIGAATTVAMVGVEDSLIKTLGRWQSSAYLSYIPVPRERLAAVSHKLSMAE